MPLAAALALCGQPTHGFGSEKRLEILDCPSVSPATTEELLCIELHTLGLALSTAQHFRVECEDQYANVQLLQTQESSGEVFVSARMALDLSSTDEAAWPRLIALAASELAEHHSARGATKPSKVHALVPRLKAVAFDVKPRDSQSDGLILGGAMSRLGEGSAWLVGPSVGAELHVGQWALLGAEVRAQWGKSSFAAGSVDWQLASASVFGGPGLRIEPMEAGCVLGVRLGQLRLKGEAKIPEESGRKLVGPTGGPFVGLRLRTQVLRGLFAATSLEVGYAWWPVEGTYDDAEPLVTVDGVWSSVTVGAGFAF